jgi:D-ribose pyranose/furanose isomerase RbsD
VLETGILYPHLYSLPSREHQTITLVIVDRCFPFWSRMEIVDLSLVDGNPEGLQVLAGHAHELRLWPRLYAGRVFSNMQRKKPALANFVEDIPITREP